MRKRLLWFLIGLVLSLGSCLIAGCDVGQEIVIPEVDPTPPEVGMTIWLEDEQIDLSPEAEAIHRDVDSETEISLLAGGKDADGGVKAVCILACIERSCCTEVIREGKKRQICQRTHCLLSASCPEAVDKRPGETARTQGIDAKVIRTADSAASCQEGWWLSWLDGAVFARAENFHGGIAETETFTFQYTR